MSPAADWLLLQPRSSQDLSSCPLILKKFMKSILATTASRQASLNWPTGSEARKGSSIHTVAFRRGAHSLAYSRKPHQRCWELPATTLHRTIITNAPAASHIWSSSAKGKHIWWRICASLCFPPAPSERSTLTPLVWTMDTLLDTERAWSWLPDCVLCILAGALCSRNRLMTKCHNSKQLAYNRVDSL